jgi:hypothetical protein
MLTCLRTDLGLPLEYISQESFPLPTLGNKLRTLATELTSGVGFFHVRGLGPQRYSNEMNVALYLGISTYIGAKRGRQDELGNMLRESFVKNDFHGTNLCLRRYGGFEKLIQKKKCSSPVRLGICSGS